MAVEILSWVPAVAGSLAGAAVLAVVMGRWIDRTAAFVVASILLVLGAATLTQVGVVAFKDTLVASLGLTVAGSLALVWRIDDPGGRWGDRLRSRLVMGIPWGTLTISTFVLLVYLFVQGGVSNWYNPVTIPFRAWSYLYPLGILTAPFSHSGPGHLVGNLTGTLVLGTLAEYAWGHFPRERGASSFGDWRTNPWVRALVVFPGAAVVVGLLTSLFSIGPVIGFSGVVFAFAGFALTRYPLGTVVAAAGFGATQTIYYALQQPIVRAAAQPSPPSPPWWAQIAIQGHALGLLAGIVLGWYVFVRRGEGPSALRLWTGVLLFGMEQTLWAVYWFGGNETYILYRGPGIVLVALLALLVTGGLTASRRGLLAAIRGDTGAETPDGAIADGGDGESGPDPDPDPDPGATGDDGSSLLNGSTVAVGLIVLGFCALATFGAVSNMFAAANPSPPADGVEVGGYTVFYAEDVTNEMVAIVDISLFNQTTEIRTSGVIVTNAQRGIWQQVVSKSRLAFSGTVTVDVGGVGWRSTVGVQRKGWSAIGGPATYKVWLYPPDGDRRLVYRAEPATAEPVLAGRNVSVAPAESGFEVVVSRNNSTLARSPIPATGNVTSAGGLTFRNQNGKLLAIRGNTSVPVATEETYE